MLKLTKYNKINRLHIGRQWCNFFIPTNASCSGCHDVRQGNINIDPALVLSLSETY